MQGWISRRSFEWVYKVEPRLIPVHSVLVTEEKYKYIVIFLTVPLASTT